MERVKKAIAALVAACILCDVSLLVSGSCAADQPLSLTNLETSATVSATPDGLNVVFPKGVGYPRIGWTADSPAGWDWSSRHALVFTLTNPSSEDLSFDVRLDDNSGSGIKQGGATISAGKTQKFYLLLSTLSSPTDSAAPGLPLSMGGNLNPAHIMEYQIFLANPTKPVTLIIKSIDLVGGAPPQPVGQLSTALSAGPPLISPVFGDNMVLQRDAQDRIWGWSAPGSVVKVTLAGKSIYGKADPSGRWSVTTKPMPAGGPWQMVVAGSHTVTLRNIMFGDVWICSGQSNAGMGIKLVNNGAQEVAAANYPNIRLYMISASTSNRPLDWPSSTFSAAEDNWRVCTPDTVSAGGWGGFSAMAYFFARDLYGKMHVPIGVISNAWGGMPIDPFISGVSLKKLPDYRARVNLLESYPNKDAVAAAEESALSSWYSQNDAGEAAATRWDLPAYDDLSWQSHTDTAYVAPAWIKDLAGVYGVIWYRINFEAPADWSRQDLSLKLGALDPLNTVYFNGNKIGGWQVGIQNNIYTAPANDVVAGRNTVAIRVLTSPLGPGVYGAVNDIWAAPASGIGSKVILGMLPWKYKIGIDLKNSSVKAPPIVDTSTPASPTMIYNGIVAPLTPMSIKGIIWYQGESSTNNATLYRTLLPLLIADWRSRFEIGQAPFLVVQLSSVGKGDTGVWSSYWAQLREAQLLTTENVPNTALVVTSDIGDPTNVHYTDKQDLGSRLATSALAVAYGEKNEYEGPIYKSMKIDGKVIRVFFTHAAGLAAKGAALLDFTIAGPDNKFVPADAVIDGESVVVSSPAVQNPVAVRYGWESYSTGNLYNKAGLPASSFRTDNLPYVPQQSW